MDFLDWRLLFVVAVFGAGWAIARVDMEQVVARARDVPDLILRGIASLLKNEQLDAGRAFLDAGQPLSRGNAELHFAAGELFRRRGDFEAAIKVHKRLLASDLDENTTVRARFELGMDYQKSGFLDLAEQCFAELEGTAYAARSLHHLFNIYMYSKSWDKAIEHETRFAQDDENNELRRHVIAQLYCEWAQQDPSARAGLLGKALQHNPACGRAWMMRAEDALEAGDGARAVELLGNLRLSPQVMVVAAGLVMKAHVAAGSASVGVNLLIQEFESQPSELMFEKVYDVISPACEPARLEAFVAQALQSIGGPVIVARWLESKRAAGDEASGQFDAPLRALAGAQTSFVCSNCDFRARSHSWQCPVCLEWETMLPPKGAAKAD